MPHSALVKHLLGAVVQKGLKTIREHPEDFRDDEGSRGEEL